MNTVRVSLDLTHFQQLCRGEGTTVTGETGDFEKEQDHEVSVEIALQDIGYDTMLISIQKPKIALIEESRLMDPDVFAKTLDRMSDFGGSFVKQLSEMARHADATNRVKCLLTWTDYFLDYSTER